MKVAKNTEDLTFEIKIHSDMAEYEDIFNLLLTRLDSTSQVGGYILSCGNVLTLDKNSMYDENVNLRQEDAWIYYKYDLSVFPEKIEKANINNQISLAKNIINILQESDCLAELIAEFDI